MIDFHETWLPQIIRYAELVADESVLRRAWLDSDRSETSIYYPGELIEQVFDDLDADELAHEMPRHLVEQPTLAVAIEDFLRLMLKWDQWVDANVDQTDWGKLHHAPKDAEAVFTCDPWISLRSQAQRVISEGRRGDQ